MERPLSSPVPRRAHGTLLLSMDFTPMGDYWIHPIGPTPGALLAPMLYGMVHNRG